LVGSNDIGVIIVKMGVGATRDAAKLVISFFFSANALSTFF